MKPDKETGLATLGLYASLQTNSNSPAGEGMLPDEVSILKIVITKEIWTDCSIRGYKAIYKKKTDMVTVWRSMTSGQVGNTTCAGLSYKFISNLHC